VSGQQTAFSSVPAAMTAGSRQILLADCWEL